MRISGSFGSRLASAFGGLGRDDELGRSLQGERETAETRRGRGNDAATALFEEVLNRGSGLRVRVSGQSMWPFLRNGDVVHIQKVPPSSLRTGDLIFFKKGQGAAVLHRLVRTRRLTDGSRAFQTKGDALVSVDERIPENKVLGKVSRVERETRSGRLECLNLESGFWSAASRFIALTWPVHSVIRRALRLL